MKNNRKGFTLAELLIVVAIIAVLVAVAIPVFTAQLEKSREAADAANIRTAYAAVQTAALMQDDATTFAQNDTENAKFTTKGSVAGGDLVYVATITLGQTQKDWQTAPLVVGGYKIESTTKTGKCIITWTQSTNKTTFEFQDKSAD